ncbi:MAG TPA: SDR family oxidoreductase [Novosphingobium sp.]|nr:SDR family oxidoreductase [Novosphingobium sp.]
MGLLDAHKALAGKVAVVLGGCAGFVGRAVTLGLVGEGVRVIACDDDREGIAGIVGEVAALGGAISAHHADVTDEAALDVFWDVVEREHDAIDFVINVAGGVIRRPFEDTTRESHARDIRLNYDYVVQSCHRAIPLLKRSGRGGAIVNFTTIEAHRGAGTFAVYAGAKAGITNFSRALAVELGGAGIRVNCLAADTSAARASYAAMGEEPERRRLELGVPLSTLPVEMYIPMKRRPEVEEVVDGVLFLVSGLSSAVTGQTLHVDGGTSASMGFLDWPEGDGFMPIPMAGTLSKLLK